MNQLEAILQSWIEDPPKKHALVEMQCDASQLLDAIKNVDMFPKMYWKGRHQESIQIGLGMVESWKNLPNQTQKKLSKNQIIFHIDAFDANQPQWNGYPTQLTFRPKMTIVFNSKTQIVSVCFDNRPNIHHNDEHPEFTKQPHCPNKSEWIEGIVYSKKLFEQSALEKIVLARQSHLTCSQPWKIFELLIEGQPNCYHFLYAPNAKSCFMGASPERLFQLKMQELQTEAIAGTRRNHPEETFDLSNNPKDQKEHQFVVDFIQSQLQPLCDDISIKEQQILHLQHVQHLYTPICATIQPAVHINQILKVLHPTPAVCGFPQALARQYIHQIENFHRGWYAGTMGCITSENVDFTVLIRSALCVDGQVIVWTGAGIVQDSIPENEWDELNNKATQFRKITNQLQS